MELIIFIIVGVILSLFKSSGSNSKMKTKGGLSDYEKYDIFNKFNKK